MTWSSRGHPATDLGNLLRFDREPAYVEGVLDGYVAGAGGGAGHVLGTGPEEGVDSARPGRRPAADLARATDLARAADLVALVDLAARPANNPVVRRAGEHLRAIARTGDVHATP
ncbi:hypothetical protein [Promicromonospora iranensis]|uniref:Uncharacterized protein n=1 Tax=Promicromonospora iranensis TaxID=1105144 RepID=A0ABU2CVL5_9MICO|nr:hypothetical protein [Promicromonospora iranensis]MDR7385384.1 hypothetical protein [Promicromonospora iranensis]